MPHGCPRRDTGAPGGTWVPQLDVGAPGEDTGSLRERGCPGGMRVPRGGHGTCCIFGRKQSTKSRGFWGSSVLRFLRTRSSAHELGQPQAVGADAPARPRHEAHDVGEDEEELGASRG